jgi:UDP-N-acetylmuramate--alanine ligase
MRCHLVGIGGVGMSALAQALLDAGCGVSGSDRLLDRGEATAVLRCLEAQGARILPQDGSGAAGAARVIVSTAIEPDNPDLKAAAAAGIPVVHRATQLAEIVADRRLIAVTGTCGKSTVTAMTGWLLAATGFDPLVVNGAGIVGWDEGQRLAAVRRGNGAWAVAEADESDRSLMVFDPEHAVITNASADHFSLAETDALFRRFRERVRGRTIEGEGTIPAPREIEASGWTGAFEWEGVRFAVPMPGRHNALNAWLAVRAAVTAGAAPRACAAALAGFRGVERRLERIGAGRGAVVVDDYAHNPAKLAAAWETLAGLFSRIAAVWRPHGYGPLRNMMEGLTEAFARVVRPGDRLWLLPVYDAGGTADRSVRSEDLAGRLAGRGVAAAVVPDHDEAAAALLAAAAPGTVLVTFGARDPGLPLLARRVAGAV